MLPEPRKWMKSFLKNDDGISAMEYCIAAACIAVTIIGSLSAIAPQVNRHLGNSFQPNAGVLLPGDCGGGHNNGNCGGGLGNGGGNGTGNEGIG